MPYRANGERYHRLRCFRRPDGVTASARNGFGQVVVGYGRRDHGRRHRQAPSPTWREERGEQQVVYEGYEGHEGYEWYEWHGYVHHSFPIVLLLDFWRCRRRCRYSLFLIHYALLDESMQSNPIQANQIRGLLNDDKSSRMSVRSPRAPGPRVTNSSSTLVAGTRPTWGT